MISGLRDPSVDWTDEQLAEALETVDQETDRLNRLVGNCSMPAACNRCPRCRHPPDGAHDTFIAALQSLTRPLMRWRSTLRRRCRVGSDPVLLERSLANVLSNALRTLPNTGCGDW